MKETMSKTSESIGEVIASHTGLLVADVLPEKAAPALGRWVCVEDGAGGASIGVVCQVEQGSLMPRRRAVAFGMSSDELQRERPHVMALLQTSFHALPVAYREANGRIRQTLPPHPAGIHAAVALCADEDINAIAPPYDFLRILVGAPDTVFSIDDLLVAVLREMHRAAGSHRGHSVLLEAGRTLSRLLRDDHERLQSILRRVR